MAISFFSHFFLSFMLSTTICITSFTHGRNPCKDDQKTLLLELKNDLIFNSSLSRKLVQWNLTDDCCSWEGVECDDTGHIISLQLDEEGISGGLENSSSLFSLKYLKKLNLAFNNFNHTEIPRGIANLKYLTHLNLSYAAFGGQVPIELSLLTRLVSLDISNSFFPSLQDQRTIVSNWGIQPPKHSEYPAPNLVTLIHRLGYDIGKSQHLDLQHHIHWEWGTQPLKLEYQNLKMLLQNLTRLKELYLDSVNISSHGGEWCHIISSSLPHLTNLSLRECNLSGPLDSSLVQLHSLSTLRLDWNNLSTAVLDILSSFSCLTTLTLKNCSIKGSFPDRILQVPTLQQLDLSYNELVNVLNPYTLANLTQLVYMDLSNNFFTGLVPSFYYNKKLAHINLGKNSLTGSLSPMHFEGLSNLNFINLGYNLLSGSLPQSLFCLPLLEVLALNNNQFNDTFQLIKIQRLPNLSFLILSNNNLSVDASDINSSFSTFPQLKGLNLASCNLHSFPDLRNQSNLKSLDLSNNKITGNIPNWIWKIGNGEVYVLNFSNNLLLDLQKPYHIPTSLHVLDLHSNLLQGELPLVVPSTIRNITPDLYYLSLANNNLSGSIPTSLCNARNLEVLDLSFNNLSDNIPPCLLQNNEHLQVLSLRRNDISGIIPREFSVNCGLETLDLSNNNLGGSIPKSLGNCKSLVAVNVGYNNIVDSFPCMLPSRLRLLILRSNGFHGELRCQKSWPNLQIIDIAHNNFSGFLYPISFSRWRGMMQDSYENIMVNYLNSNIGDVANYYQYEVALTIKGQEREIVKIWGDFASIDLSCNNFRGTVPDALGDLESLDYLNLSHNALTGIIPKAFGKLRQLGSLDLSVNQLTGMIPVEFSGLTFLEVLNLSHNNLVGMIPIGPQIQTFSADSFDGNTGLCGLPLNISCSNSDENGFSRPKSENVEPHGKAEVDWDYVAAALGCVVGLGSFVWLFLCCRCLRRRYFEKIDEILEKIFGHGKKKRRH